MELKKTSTSFEIYGYKIIQNLGVVRGVTVRSRSIFGNIGAAFQTLAGGNITLYTELCERTRKESFDIMIAHAEQLGGNAVIGVRYDTTEIMSGVTEVICYGTAVIVD
ncbi:MAG: YbjQ family protein [Bacteroidetes bacterium]|nr:YbjQ family protein [Bacteroidota bacterium]